MAIRGRKPKPTELKLLTGVRSDRINKDAPLPIVVLPECPAHLCKVAKKEWERIVPILSKAGVLSQTDGTAIAIYCALYARWVKAQKELQKDGGMTADTASGGEKVSPWVQIAASAERDMARMLVEFGCTPSSRSRIVVTNRKPTDPLSKFQKKA